MRRALVVLLVLAACDGGGPRLEAVPWRDVVTFSIAAAAAIAAVVSAWNSRTSASSAKAAVEEARVTRQAAIEEAQAARKDRLAPRLTLERNFSHLVFIWPPNLETGMPAFLAIPNGDIRGRVPPTFTLQNFGQAPALELSLLFELDDPNGELQIPSYCQDRGIVVEDFERLPDGTMLKMLNFANPPGRGAAWGGTGLYLRASPCAGFTRGDQIVLPDVTAVGSEIAPQSAEIEVIEDGEARRFTYYPRTRASELRGFYAFDSTSVTVHLTGQNAFSFSPAGLEVLSRLSEVIDAVKRRLERRVSQACQPNSFTRYFEEPSEISNIVKALSARTDIRRLQQLATLTDDDHARAAALESDLEAYRAKQLDTHIERVRQWAADIEQLRARLARAASETGPAVQKRAFALLRERATKARAANELGVATFKTPHLNEVGSQRWRQLIGHAAAFAKDQERPGRTYPQPGSHCLLCQQPMSPEAQDLLKRAFRFLAQDAQSVLEDAESAILREAERLRRLRFDFLGSDTVVYRQLQGRHPALLRQCVELLEACQVRQAMLVQALSTLKEVGMRDPMSTPDSAIEELQTAIATRLKALKQQKDLDPTARLTRELVTYTHSRRLAEHVPAIREYVEKLAWADRAAAQVVSTRHVTVKHNELFGELVSDRYVELFGKTLRRLGRNVTVSVYTSGRKAGAYKQIRLKPASDEGFEEMDVLAVFSEGEKRAVALADFLTEVALDTNSSGIILDDPVTSLDLEWRTAAAALLVEESTRRQVIVFTHDLPFVYYVRAAADAEGSEAEFHWVMRGPSDNRPGYVFLDNCPALERDYVKAKRARELHAKAIRVGGAEQEALIGQAFAALRTSYEAFIVFDLFKNVVARFDERISVGRLRDVVWDPAIRDEAVSKYEYLSRYIEGHLHSDAFAASKPTPAALLSEIEEFEALRRRLKELTAVAAR